LFRIPTENLAFYDRNMNLVIEPGDYRVMVGRNSEDIVLEGKFRIVGDKQILYHKKYYLAEAIELQ
ncbi:MAG: fibronectin type III-like domain-contianing protein, partial [Desulfurococcaceae archaeon]|nr:fibronectin type III-like domain-contianing protein [Desulfurococcaceae archaeon]